MNQKRTPHRIRCGRCRKSFRVELPRNKGLKGASWTRCSEPDSGRRFWHGQGEQGGPVICGVDPKDVPEIAA